MSCFCYIYWWIVHQQKDPTAAYWTGVKQQHSHMPGALWVISECWLRRPVEKTFPTPSRVTVSGSYLEQKELVQSGPAVVLMETS